MPKVVKLSFIYLYVYTILPTYMERPRMSPKLTLERLIALIDAIDRSLAGELEPRGTRTWRRFASYFYSLLA